MKGNESEREGECGGRGVRRKCSKGEVRAEALLRGSLPVSHKYARATILATLM